MIADLTPEPLALSERVREWAGELGFDAVGIAPAGPSAHAEHYRGWVAAGHAGEMTYLAREDALAKRADPALVVPRVRSAIVLAKGYSPPGDDRAQSDPSSGIFARYARNEDYHQLLEPRLIALQEKIDAELGGVNGRAYVDTGPVLERELAARAGIGWFGRNTMLIQPRRGSYYFLGVILLDVELAYDEPFERDLCGSCDACVDQCPTGALLGRDDAGAPRMDARRCISYLTIELKGPIPRELRPLLGNRIYGCDICQEVCPHNNPKWVQITEEEAFWPRRGVHGGKLIELMGMDQEEFSRRFKNSPVKRTKRRGLLRNVAVALGNWGSAEGVPVLAAALHDEEPLVRGHAAWALGQVASREGTPSEVVSHIGGTLVSRLCVEEDEWVKDEISLALTG